MTMDVPPGRDYHTVPYHDAGQEILALMQAEGHWYAEWLVSQFAGVLHGDILEVGCGIGTVTRLLARYGRVTGVDGDPACVAETVRRVPDARAVLGNLESGRFDLPAAQQFDVCVSVNVHEHIADDAGATAAMARRLRPGGTLVVLVPAHPWLYTHVDRALGHHRRYTRSRLEQLATHAGLAVDQVRRLNWLGAAGWGLSGHLLRRRTITRRDLGAFTALAPLALWLDRQLPWPFGLSLLMVARKTV